MRARGRAADSRRCARHGSRANDRDRERHGVVIDETVDVVSELQVAASDANRPNNPCHGRSARADPSVPSPALRGTFPSCSCRSSRWYGRSQDGSSPNNGAVFTHEVDPDLPSRGGSRGERLCREERGHHHARARGALIRAPSSSVRHGQRIDYASTCRRIDVRSCGDVAEATVSIRGQRYLKRNPLGVLGLSFITLGILLLLIGTTR